MAVTQQTAKTQYVSSEDVKYAYRRFGKQGGVPLLFLHHFRGTMDFWDPLLINTIARQRTVILYDNAGIGQSTGEVAKTGKDMANHVLTFLSLLNITEVDVLGFSLGGVITPLVFLNTTDKGLVRKLIVAGAGVSYGEDVATHTLERNEEVKRLAGAPQPGFDEGFDKLFYYPSPTSQAAGRAAWARIHERSVATSGEERSKLASESYANGGVALQNLSAVFANFADPEQRADGTYDRLTDVTIPVFVAQGQDDFMIPTSQSFLMQQKFPNAYLKIFPNSGHAFLFQYAEEFSLDVDRFLNV